MNNNNDWKIRRGDLPILPPIIIDGEPKVLHAMTHKELRCLISLMLKAIYRPASFHATSLRLTEKPPWWPMGVPFSNNNTQLLLPSSDKADRSSMLRHIITSCYSYYKQENRLHLFDGYEGEPLRWRLMDDGLKGWNLIDTTSREVVWNFAQSYQILPLLSLKAQFEGAAELIDESEGRSTPAPRQLRTRATAAYIGHAPIIELPSTSGSTGSVTSLHGSSRKSILSLVSSREKPKLEIPVIRHWSWNCTECDSSHGTELELIGHMVKNHYSGTSSSPSSPSKSPVRFSPRVRTRDKAKKADFLFHHLGLVPTSVVDSLPEPTLHPGKPSHQLSVKLGKVPFSSASGRLIHETIPHRYKDEEPLYETGCESSPLVVPRDTKIYPVCYRPTRLINHYHTLKLSRAEYRAFKPNLKRPKYVVRKKDRLTMLKSLTKPCEISMSRSVVSDWLEAKRKRDAEKEAQRQKARVELEAKRQLAMEAAAKGGAFSGSVVQVKKVNIIKSPSKLMAEEPKIEEEGSTPNPRLTSPAAVTKMNELLTVEYWRHRREMAIKSDHKLPIKGTRPLGRMGKRSQHMRQFWQEHRNLHSSQKVIKLSTTVKRGPKSKRANRAAASQAFEDKKLHVSGAGKATKSPQKIKRTVERLSSDDEDDIPLAQVRKSLRRLRDKELQGDAHVGARKRQKEIANLDSNLEVEDSGQSNHTTPDGPITGKTLPDSPILYGSRRKIMFPAPKDKQVLPVTPPRPARQRKRTAKFSPSPPRKFVTIHPKPIKLKGIYLPASPHAQKSPVVSITKGKVPALGKSRPKNNVNKSKPAVSASLASTSNPVTPERQTKANNNTQWYSPELGTQWYSPELGIQYANWAVASNPIPPCPGPSATPDRPRTRSGESQLSVALPPDLALDTDYDVPGVQAPGLATVTSTVASETPPPPDPPANRRGNGTSPIITRHSPRQAQSTVFKCHVCSFESLFQGTAVWVQVREHMTQSHPDTKAKFVQREQPPSDISTYSVMLIEAFPANA